jgi:hypothetical protein
MLGMKYKMTALKIHAAVCELSVANRMYYKEVVIGFGALYTGSFLFYLYMMIIIPKVNTG